MQVANPNRAQNSGKKFLRWYRHSLYYSFGRTTQGGQPRAVGGGGGLVGECLCCEHKTHCSADS